MGGWGGGGCVVVSAKARASPGRPGTMIGDGVAVEGLLPLLEDEGGQKSAASFIAMERHGNGGVFCHEKTPSLP